jgi:hypothetical protein
MHRCPKGSVLLGIQSRIVASKLNITGCQELHGRSLPLHIS